jgi:predicted MFS family arabinose efflux permease
VDVLKLVALTVAFVALLIVALAQWIERRRLLWDEIFVALAAGVAVGILLADWLGWR